MKASRKLGTCQSAVGAYYLLRMDALDDITRRMRVCKLESRLALREIERDSLSREVKSPMTSPDRRGMAIERIYEIETEWAAIFAELQSVRGQTIAR